MTRVAIVTEWGYPMDVGNAKELVVNGIRMTPEVLVELLSHPRRHVSVETKGNVVYVKHHRCGRKK